MDESEIRKLEIHPLERGAFMRAEAYFSASVLSMETSFLNSSISGFVSRSTACRTKVSETSFESFSSPFLRSLLITLDPPEISLETELNTDLMLLSISLKNLSSAILTNFHERNRHQSINTAGF